MRPFLLPREKVEMRTLVSNIIRSSEGVCTIYRKSVAAHASAVTGTAGTDRILWTAKDVGAAGNAITVTLVADAVYDESVSVVGNNITCHIADASTMVADVLALVVGSTEASALVEVSSTDTGIVAAADTVTLSGGVDINEALYGSDDAEYSVLAVDAPMETAHNPPIDIGKNIDAVACVLYDQDVRAEDHILFEGILYRVQTVDDNPTFGCVTHKVVQLVKMHDAVG